MPILTLQDPMLSNHERICLMQIFQFAREAGTGTAFPSYTWLRQKLGVRSDTTIATILGVLRVLRWTTLCRRVRDGGGKFRGNVYAAHDQPLELADTLFLDPDYMRFLQESTRHSNRRLQRIALSVLQTIQEDLDQGIDVTELVSPLERQAQAMETLRAVEAGETPNRGLRFFSVRGTQIHYAKPVQDDESDRLQKLETVETPPSEPSPKIGDGGNPLQKMETDTDSTIWSPPTLVSQSVSKPTDKQDDGFEFPERCALAPNIQRVIAMKLLGSVERDWRQPLLNELLGRMATQANTTNAIRKPIKYLDQLIRLWRDGQAPLTELSLGAEHWAAATRPKRGAGAQQPERSRSDLVADIELLRSDARALRSMVQMATDTGSRDSLQKTLDKSLAQLHDLQEQLRSRDLAANG
ncbi:MAG: hypothetical protein KDI42_07760 [Gammaproteobacteria bacterium]|nr:hypothetical protein [Gammaproteobacteria bacterium]